MTSRMETTTGGESYILPDFMPAARDIMQPFPRCPEAAGAATEARVICEAFGTLSAT
jgi:hypothetical protein